MVKDKMHQGAEGKQQEPGLAMTPVEIHCGGSNDKEKEEGVGKHSAATEKQKPYGFVNEVGKHGAEEDEAIVYREVKAPDYATMKGNLLPDWGW